MISILFGPAGAGKSFYQMHVIVRELRTSKRNIVTNLSIEPEAFNAYLERKYPNESLNLVSRLRLLTREETLSFWKYRGPRTETFKAYVAPTESREVGVLASYEYTTTEDSGVNGVAYIIDEAGVCGFSAAGWAQRENGTTRGTEASWYLDQQRKFGDNVYASHNGTNPHGIAKPFRDKAHDFTQLRNGRLRKMGIFKARGVFTAWHYYLEPGPNVEFYAKEDFPLDLDLANCYRTGDGVGIVGGKADIGSKVKGIPVLWAFPLAIAVGSLTFIVPWMGAHLLGNHIRTASGVVNVGVNAGIHAAGGVGQKAASARVVDGLTVSGVAEYPGVVDFPNGNRAVVPHLEVILSNGDRYSSDDCEVKRVSPLYYLVDGNLYRYKKPVTGNVLPDAGPRVSPLDFAAHGVAH